MSPEEQAAADLVTAQTEEAAAFHSEIQDVPVTPTEPVVPPVVAAVPEVVPAPVVTPEVVTPPPTPYQVTEAQINDLVTKARSVDDLSVTLGKVHASLYGDVYGKLGGLERVIKQLQESTPAGQAIEVGDKDLEELKEEFPDLTAKLAKGLTRILSKFKGTAQPGVVQTPVNTDEIFARTTQAADARVASSQEAILRRVAVDRLTDKHEDWKEIIGEPDATTPYRTWLQSQDSVYRTKILGTWDPREIGKSIDKFKEYEKAEQKKTAQPQVTPPKGQDARSQRLLQAISPKGNATPPVHAGELTEAEAFKKALHS